MSTQDRKAKAQAAAKAHGKGANAIVIGGIVVVIAMVLVIGGVVIAATQGGGGGKEAPAGVAKGEPLEPYADATPAKDAPVVDVYEDFRCPHCKTFEQATGETITDLAEDGTIRLRVHLMTVIDNNAGGESSAVAGSSAVCAADQDAWTDYHRALFARQPQGGEFPESAFTEAADEAGLEGDARDAWQQCTDDKQYVDYVQSVDDAAAESGVRGTPAIEVEGTKLEWQAVVSEQGQVDTAQLEEILTSGEVPEDMVASE